MVYLPYVEGALLVAAVAAPIGIRLGFRGFRQRPRRFVVVRHPDPPKPEPKPNRKPEPPPRFDQPKVTPAAADGECEQAEGGTTLIQVSKPEAGTWSTDIFVADTSNQISPGPVWLTFKQIQPIILDPADTPVGHFNVYFGIPEGGAFDQMVPSFVNSYVQGKAITLFFCLPAASWPARGDPAVTGMSRQGFPYMTTTKRAFNSPAGNAALRYLTVRDNNGYLVPGPPRVIVAQFWFDGSAVTTIGRPGGLWVFFSVNGVGPEWPS